MVLPLLAYTYELYPNVDLSKTLLIGCQHVVGTTMDLFQELLKKGLRPENAYVLGKCYSTNTEAFASLKALEIQVSPLSTVFNSHVSFDEQFQAHINAFLDDIQHEQSFAAFEKIILLDDGGFLLMAAKNFFHDHGKLIGIEQTSSGFEKIKDAELPFPIINVARSRAKLEGESPLIAAVVVEKIIEYIHEVKLVTPKILIVGQGYIGRAVAELLAKNYSVETHDANQGVFNNHHEFDLIIGATGQPIISPEQFFMLKKSVHLISVSSSDREFSAVSLRKLAAVSQDCHKNISINDIHLVNGGFPINFDGRLHPVAPEQIQLTRSLLLAGVCEVENGSHAIGLHDLSSLQDSILTKFFSLNPNDV